MKHLSLKAKIYLSAIVLVAVFLMNGIIFYFGHANERDSVKLIRQTDSINAQALALDRDVQELRFRVDRFIGSGHASLVQDVEEIQQRLTNQIDSAKAIQFDEKMNDRFARIQTHVDEYGKQFKTVVAERQLEKDLVQNQLPTAGAKVDSLLESFADEMSSGENQSDLALSYASSDFSKAEKLVLQYFANPDSKLVASAVKALNDARSKITKIESKEQDKQVVLKALDNFQRIALRAVQATRSYLLQRNVVMAGEASEIAYHSYRLRKSTQNRQREITRQFEATSRRVSLITFVSILVASVLSLFIATRLVVAILPSVTKLTDTFVRLSEGETLSDIPGTDRGDEIGQMARAASIFSDQNLQTQFFLQESERLNATLKKQTKKLEASNEELDSFAYVASHDLKSPLRGIRQLATWIQEDSVESLTPLTTEYLEKMIERVSRMETLLDDLLNFSRVGRLSQTAEMVDVNELLDNVVAITDNPEQVSLEWSQDMPSFCTVRSPLEQVLLNLIGNAIKHNDKGSDGKVTVTATQANDFWSFCIADNGPGIAPKYHKRAFQMYQRVGDTTVDGSGMGLAIVKKQVEHFGGTIELDSEAGEGASFTFSWPIRQPTNSKEAS